MNGADLGALGLVGLFGYLGYRRGGLDMAASFLALAGGLGAAVLGMRPAAEALPVFGPGATSRAGWFLVLFVSVHLPLLVLLSRHLRRRHEAFARSCANRWLGVPPGLAEGTLVAAMLALVLLLVPQRAVAQGAIIEGSLTAPLLGVGASLQAAIHEEFGSGVRQLLGMPPPIGREEATYPLPPTGRIRADAEAEEELLALLNGARVEAGLRPLSPAPDLAALARAHSEDMWRRGYFGHRDPEGRDVAGRMEGRHLAWLLVGENLALAPSARVAHRGLLESPGHRANILDERFHSVGIGAVRGPVGVTFTQVFRD